MTNDMPAVAPIPPVESVTHDMHLKLVFDKETPIEFAQQMILRIFATATKDKERAGAAHLLLVEVTQWRAFSDSDRAKDQALAAEMRKIAELVGEDDDPFAAWEHIAPLFDQVQPGGVKGGAAQPFACEARLSPDATHYIHAPDCAAHYGGYAELPGDAGAIAEYRADLEAFEPDELDQEISSDAEELANLESFLEAAAAWKRKLGRDAKDQADAAARAATPADPQP